MATSPAIPARPIGRLDGPDRAILYQFAIKPSNFVEIEPAVQHTLSGFLFKIVLKL